MYFFSDFHKTIRNKISLGNLGHHFIVVGVVLLSVLIGASSYRLVSLNGLTLMAYILFAGVCGIAFIMLALHKMSLALTLLVAVSATVNFSLSTGTNSPVNITVILVAALTGFWVFRMIVVEKKIWLVPTSLYIPLFGFLLVLILAWLGGYTLPEWKYYYARNAFQVQAAQFVIFALSAAAFLLAANHKLSQRDLKHWTWIIVLLGILAIGGGVFNQPNPLPAVTGGMLMWPIVLLFSQLLFNPKIRTNIRIAGCAILLLWGYWVFFTYALRTKSLWAPALAAMFLLLSFRSLKWSVIFGAFGAALIFLGGIWDRILFGESASSFRPLIWLDVIRMTSANWLLGLGPVNYMYYWQKLGLDSITAQEMLNRYGRLFKARNYIVPPSHNMFVDIFSQSGVIGLLFFMAFVIIALRFAWRFARSLRPGFLQAHVYGVMCGFTALTLGSFIFGDWLIPFVYNIGIRGFQHSVYSWLLLGTLVSARHFLREGKIDASN